MRPVAWLLLLLGGSGTAQVQRSGDVSLQKDTLALHNSVRARLKVAPLVWSDRLAARAQDWADTLIKRGQFIHRPNSSYGENLFEITGALATAARVVNAWAAESQNYDYRSNRCRGVCGHYTQIVWRDTKEIGCGLARAGRREVWVCNYDPPGNWTGQRPY